MIHIGGNFPIQLQPDETMAGTDLGGKTVDAIDDAVASARKLIGNVPLKIDIKFEVYE